MFPLTHRSAVRSVVGPDDLHVDHPVGAASVRVVPAAAADEERARVPTGGGPTSTLHELLLAVASGDQEAFAVLERRIGGLVRVNIRRVLRDASRSDAVTQAFFAEVPRDASEFDPDRDNAQVWLLTRAYLRAMSGLAPAPAARR